jgi:hypothetical protein
MACVQKCIYTLASADEAWSALADIGALHTRLVPGFVSHCEWIADGRRVTFANGAVVDEPIVACDGGLMRLAWTARGGASTHYNASAQVFAQDGGARIVWTADFLPDALAPAIDAAMSAGAQAMKAALDKLGREG